MAGNHLKTPLNVSLSAFTEQKVSDGNQLQGKSLPCVVSAIVSPGTVRVRFEVNSPPWTLPEMEVPVLGSRYVRLPVQIGDRGMVIAADARLGGVTGLGGSVAALDAPGNLSALVFAWLGNKNWEEATDPDAVCIIAPNGAVIQDDAKSHTVKVSPEGIDLDENIKVDGNNLAFFGGSPTSKKTVTGLLSAVTDPNAKAVLTSLINAMSQYTLIQNGTT